MSIQPITFTHREIVVTYDAQNDWFICDLFKRGAATPGAAMARIDDFLAKQNLKPVPKFERFEAWYKGFGFSSTYTRVTVTSLAESDEAWITHGGSRQKTSQRSLYPVNPKNDAIIADLLKTEKAISELRDQQTALHSKLKSVLLS